MPSRPKPEPLNVPSMEQFNALQDQVDALQEAFEAHAQHGEQTPPPPPPDDNEEPPPLPPPDDNEEPVPPPPAGNYPRGLLAAKGHDGDRRWYISDGEIQDAKNHGCVAIAMGTSVPQFRDEDITQDYLNDLDDTLGRIINAGLVPIFRLAYWYHWDGIPTNQRIDAEPAQANRHIDQLAPYLNKYANKIIVQIGVIGRWGEGDYGDVPVRPYGHRHEQNANRVALFRKVFASFKGMPIAVRYATDIKGLKSILSQEDWARVAWHRDAVLTEPMEWGTYQPELQTGHWFHNGDQPEDPDYQNDSYKQWLRDNFLNVPRIVFGEFGESTDFEGSDFVDAMNELFAEQYSLHSWDSGVPYGQNPDDPSDGIKARLIQWGLWDDFVRRLQTG